MEQGKTYPLAIIGAGPAGLSASIYASRYGVDHIVIGHLPGGQISETHEIDNYPGVDAAGGFEFAESLMAHARKFGAPIESRMVVGVRKEDGAFVLLLDGGSTVRCRALLLATGTKRRALGIPREDEFVGRGVSYCATCDGFFYRGKTVAVIGGSNSAAGAALYLSDIAVKVYLVYRGDELRAEAHTVNRLREKGNVSIILGTNVVSLSGTETLTSVTLDRPYDGSETLPVDGLFIEIGSDPSADFARDLGVETDESGFVKVAADMTTNVPGVFAAGDLTDGSAKFRQVVTAAAEGAIAARSIHAYLSRS
ncbi:MAG: FAD-dependent oxidoreductase [Candidatus Moranbacteria bacterium]|nr:FAD-dependent oxidoreductase [Candidatus Moranbacteria bacterium]